MKKINGNDKKEETLIPEETPQEEIVILEKATHVALASYNKCHVTPFKDSDGRVRFKAKGAVTQALADIQNNSLVRIGDYLSKLEAVRSVIFSLKGNRTAAL